MPDTMNLAPEVELARLRAELAQSHGGDREDEEERAGIRERIAEIEAALNTLEAENG